MAIILNWCNPNAISIMEDEIRLYRHTSAFNEGNLPPVLVTLPSGTNRYTDSSATDGTLYFYRVGLVKKGNLFLSELHQVRAPFDGTAVTGSRFEYVDCPKYFLQDFGKIPLLDSGHADSIRGDNFSTRKILAAMVIVDEKQAVLDTEYVTITSEDINSTGGEWLTGFQVGDQVTWRDLLKLLLVPSKSDIAATCNRILGEYLRNKYKVGANNDQSFGYFMTQAGLRSGCIDIMAFSNSPTYPTNSHDVSVTPHQTLFSARTMATLIGYVYGRYPILVDILKSTAISVAVKRGDQSVNLSFLSMTKNQHGSGGYEIGKTGDSGELGHEMFVFTTPSGHKVCGVALENPSRDSRWVNVSSMMLSLPNLHPEYRSLETATDPNESSLAFRVQGDAFTDVSPNKKNVTAISTAKTQESIYFKDRAIYLDGQSGFLVDGVTNIGLKDFTLEVYFRKIDGIVISSAAEVVGQWTAVDNGRSWGLQLDAPSKIIFWMSQDGKTLDSLETNIPTPMLTKKMPIHIVVQRKSGELAIFVNGVLMIARGSVINIYPTLSNILVGCRSTTIGGKEYINFLPGVEIHEVSMKLGVAEYDMKGFTPTYRWRRWD